MKVREWLEALEQMNPEYEVRAMDLRGEWVKVAPIQVRWVATEPMRRAPDPAAFVKVVRHGDEWGHSEIEP